MGEAIKLASVNLHFHGQKFARRTVKCQNLCYLNLSFYFNLLRHFKSIMLSIIFLLLLPRRYTSIIQCNCYFTHTTFTPTCQHSPCHFCYSQPTCLLPHHILISTPFSHFHFPSTFFTLCLLITQVKTLPPSHKL